MNKSFEKILERLEELKNHYHKCCLFDYNDGEEVGLIEAISIVQEVSEEYKDGWIPCSVRLPEESLNSVIGWDAYRNRCVFVQYIQGKFQNIGTDASFDIKAWQPLPEPFKECNSD